METHSVAVIICAHTMERLHDIRAAVASVQSQTRQPDEVVPVIDHNPLLFAFRRFSAALAGGLAVTAGGYAEMKIKAGRA